jgi:hypothetical protein
VVRLRLVPAGLKVVDEVIAVRRAELERLVTQAADWWRPGVINALHAFAEAAAEQPEPSGGWAGQLSTRK